MVRLASRNRSARRRPLESSSATRRRVSIESWMGKIGFFSSWARRLAISRHAATRSAWSARSRDAASSSAMRSNRARTGAAMRADRSDAASQRAGQGDDGRDEGRSPRPRP